MRTIQISKKEALSLDPSLDKEVTFQVETASGWHKAGNFGSLRIDAKNKGCVVVYRLVMFSP